MRKINKFTGNKIYLYDDFAVIILRNNKSKIVGKCKIDLEDLDKISKYKWCSGHGYAGTTGMGKTTYMHRFLLIKENDKRVVHHINGDRLDNRKDNLRILSSRKHLIMHNRERKTLPNIIDCRKRSVE